MRDGIGLTTDDRKNRRVANRLLGANYWKRMKDWSGGVYTKAARDEDVRDYIGNMQAEEGLYSTCVKTKSDYRKVLKNFNMNHYQWVSTWLNLCDL